MYLGILAWGMRRWTLDCAGSDVVFDGFLEVRYSFGLLHVVFVLFEGFGLMDFME